MNYFSLDFVRYGVCASLSPVELEKHSTQEDSPYYSTLNDPEFLVVLCEKWSLPQVATFSNFMLLWLKEYIFSPDIPLEYILTNYRRVYSTSKAVRVATRKGRDDFCEYLLEKYPKNQNIQENIAIGGLQRPEILVKDESILSRLYVLTKACRLGMREFLRKHDYYGMHRNILAIVMREEPEFSKKVRILGIAIAMKDVSVFTNPYYLNHPGVTTKYNIEKITLIYSPLLYRHFGVTVDDLLIYPSMVMGTKKLCEYYDEIGFDVWQRVKAKDVDGLKWLDFRARKRMRSLIVEKHHSFCDAREKRIVYSIREGRAECEGTANSDYYTTHLISPDMIEWFEDNIKK